MRIIYGSYTVCYDSIFHVPLSISRTYCAVIRMYDLVTTLLVLRLDVSVYLYSNQNSHLVLLLLLSESEDDSQYTVFE